MQQKLGALRFLQSCGCRLVRPRSPQHVATFCAGLRNQKMLAPRQMGHAADGNGRPRGEPPEVYRMATQVPGQRSGLHSAAAAGTNGSSRRADAAVAPAPSAALPIAAPEQFSGSQDDWAFFVPPAVQEGSGVRSDHHREPPHAALNQRGSLQQIGRDDDCDAELIIPCRVGADVFAEEVILC